MAEQIDIHFQREVIPPAETFGDTMRLHYGWSSPVRDEDGRLKPNLPFVADIDGVEFQIEAMQAYAAATFCELGGGEGEQPFEVDYETVLDFVRDADSQEYFGVWGFEEEIARLAFRYLSGEGDNYDAFHAMAHMHRVD